MAQIVGYNDVMVPPYDTKFPNCSISVGAYDIDSSITSVRFDVSLYQNDIFIEKKSATCKPNSGSASSGTINFTLNSSPSEGKVRFDIDLINVNNPYAAGQVIGNASWEYDYAKYKPSKCRAYMRMNDTYIPGTFWVNDNGAWKRVVGGK